MQPPHIHAGGPNPAQQAVQPFTQHSPFLDRPKPPGPVHPPNPPQAAPQAPPPQAPPPQAGPAGVPPPPPPPAPMADPTMMAWRQQQGYRPIGGPHANPLTLAINGTKFADILQAGGVQPQPAPAPGQPFQPLPTNGPVPPGAGGSSLPPDVQALLQSQPQAGGPAQANPAVPPQANPAGLQSAILGSLAQPGGPVPPSNTPLFSALRPQPGAQGS